MIRSAPASVTLLALAMPLLGACQLPDDVIATRLSVADGGSGGVGAGEPREVCTDFTPVLSTAVDGVSQDTCVGWIARRAFSHAVCSCSDLDVLAVLASDALDSSSPDAPPDERVGAAVGVNGNYAGGEYVRIGGSFTVSGRAALVSRGGIDVSGDLRLAPPASAAGPIFIGRDAWLLDAASSKSLATIGRDLHLGPQGSITASGATIALGRTSHESFDVAPPCDCADASLVDVGGAISQSMAQNDNRRIGLALDALSNVVAPTQLTLSCGRFALQKISGEAELSLRIAGRVVLVIDGDVEADRRFSLELAPGAELDLFIRGNLTVSPESLIGDNARPGATRIYVLGSQDIALPGTARFSANLYAPHAPVLVLPLGDVYGSVFAAAISSLGPLLVHYDRAVLHADQECRVTSPTRCAGCDQCGAGKACVAGACSACTSDEDCCFPLACNAGACQPLGAD